MWGSDYLLFCSYLCCVWSGDGLGDNRKKKERTERDQTGPISSYFTSSSSYIFKISCERCLANLINDRVSDPDKWLSRSFEPVLEPDLLQWPQDVRSGDSVLLVLCSKLWFEALEPCI